MAQGKIGVQMMMLKHEIEERGMLPALEKLAELGFHTIEVSQIPMTEENIRQLQYAAKELGIRTAAMSCGLEDLSASWKYPGDTLANDFDKIVRDCQAVDCRILRLGMLPLRCAVSPEEMLAMIDRCEGFAQALKPYGIDFYYHAHSMEFYRWQGKPILTHMRERTQALGFELDSHWMWRGGVDPVEYIRQFRGRIRLLHLKDYRIGLMASGDHQPGDIFGPLEEFAEVGEGSLNMPAIIQAGLESGSEYFIIEQDNTYGRNVYDSLRISRDHLIAMGYGSWF